MDAQGSDETPSETSHERGRRSNELKAQLHALVLEKLVKLLHKYHRLLSILVIVTSVVSQAVFLSEGIVGRFKSTLLTGLGVLVMVLELVLRFCTRYTYLRTAAVVVKDYALLLMINNKYMCIEIAIIPVIILCFIGVLASKVRENESSPQRDQRREPTESTAEELIKLAMMPYLLQLSLVIWTQYKGQQGIIFIFSDFLLFFSSVLCELAVMIRSPPVGDSPGSAQVIPVMQQTCIIMLMITAQTMTAEWLGEDIMLVCMPELIALLAWLGIHIHRAGAGASVKLGRSGYLVSFVEDIIYVCVTGFMEVLAWLDIRIDHASLGVRMSSATSVVVGIVALLLSAYENDESISQASWLVRLFCISSSCSALSHFHVWLLHQWPAGSTANSSGLIKLNDSSTIIFRTSRILCFATMVNMVISVGPWIFLLHEATWPAVALLLVPLIFSCEQPQQRANSDVQHRGEHLHRYDGGLDELPPKISLLDRKLHKLRWDNELSEIKGGIRTLRDYFISMRVSLDNHDYFQRKDRVNAQIKDRVREFIYDMTDWVDLSERRGTFSRRYPGVLRVRIQQFMALKHFQRRARDVMVQLDLLINNLATEDVPRSTASLDAPLAVDSSSQLVGMDGPREKVVEMVAGASSDHDLRVLIIVGMVGSGKTTLAREVYNHISQNFEFDCRLSVSVGQTEDMAKVLRHMLSELGVAGDFDVDSDYIIADADEVPKLLSDRLKQHLQDKSCLIMIEDLWSTHNWFAIRRCLAENNRHRSRIIITTRNQNFAQYDYVIHRTLPLDEADSRELFHQRTFGDSLNCPDDLKDVSDKILRKCGGLPLALVNVGNMLANMPRTQKSFESFLKRGAFYRLGLQGQLASFQLVERMRRAIGLAYNNLDEKLRACLLYLSIFPEECEIKTNKLAKLYVAEGFMDEEFSGEHAEEKAKYLINDLVTRNMIQFQPSDLNYDFHYNICVVHPVIHDFIVWQAMEENFVTIAQAGNNFDRDRTVRRLTIFDETFVGEEGIDLSNARSVTVFGGAKGIPPLTKLSLVRVLDLEDYEGPICLDGLCKLVLLRYLNLRGTDVSELPENIGDLRYLRTLDVRSTKVKELPPSIVKLENLVHLLAGNVKLPHGIGKMKALYTLSCAVVGSSSARVLLEISKIRLLGELELFCDNAILPTGGFERLERLRIQINFPSLIFQPGGLPRVRVLELKIESMELAPVVSGLLHLPSLEIVRVDRDSVPATLEAVMNAAKLCRYRPQISQVRWEEFY